MVIWLISDTHFNHTTMIKEQWRNFKTVGEMNSIIIEQWNSVVSDDDTVYHLGDVAMNNKTSYYDVIKPQLKGNIIHIRGNHDPLRISHIQSLIIQFKGKTFELVHNPMDATFTTDYIIHGHIHKSGKGDINVEEPHRLYNVNLEFHKYKPKSINEILGELVFTKKNKNVSPTSETKGLSSLRTIV